MTIEDRLAELGITLPDFSDGNYYGTTYGKMKTHHIVGNVLYLSGHTPVQNGQVLHPGRVGGEITPEQGYEAARLTGINMIAGMKHALGDLGRVKGLIRCLCFVACEPDFNDVHLVSSGCSDVLFDVSRPGQRSRSPETRLCPLTRRQPVPVSRHDTAYHS